MLHETMVYAYARLIYIPEPIKHTCYMHVQLVIGGRARAGSS